MISDNICLKHQVQSEFSCLPHFFFRKNHRRVFLRKKKGAVNEKTLAV
jgi:hypothetical protein